MHAYPQPRTSARPPTPPCCAFPERFVSAAGAPPPASATNFTRACAAGFRIKTVGGRVVSGALEALGAFGCASITTNATNGLAAVGNTTVTTSTFSLSANGGFVSATLGYNASRILALRLVRADGTAAAAGAFAGAVANASLACPANTTVVGFHGTADAAAPYTVGLFCR